MYKKQGELVTIFSMKRCKKIKKLSIIFILLNTGRDGKTAYCHMFLSDEDFYRECGYVRSD